jgi:hypothetical protein
MPFAPDALNVPWIDSPFFDRLLQQAHLSSETRALVERFHEDGYVVIDLDIERSLLDAAAESVLPHFHYGAPVTFADDRRVMDGWLISDAVHKVAILPQVMDILRLLYRREPIPFQTLNFCRGSEQRTHSDTIHFHSMPHGFMCGVWVALEDIDENNGPLHYYPRSHRLPIFQPQELGFVGSTQQHQYENMPLYEDFVEALLPTAGLERVNIRVKKGQAFIWSANLFHGGSPIVDPGRTRHSQVTHFFFEDCVYYTPLLSDPALGRITQRDVIDIRTRAHVPPRYHRTPVQNIDDAIVRVGANDTSVENPGQAGILSRLVQRLLHPQK